MGERVIAGQVRGPQPAARRRRRHRLLAGLLVLAVLGPLAVLWALRAGLDRMLFPPVELYGTVNAQETWLVPGSEGDGSALMLRRFGVPVLGCVVFFPGQKGGVADYVAALFPPLLARGAAVFAVSYPGQDGAPGQPRLREQPRMAAQAIEEVMQHCAPLPTVVLGRSLGAMPAAYGAALARPAALVLEGAPASLSDAVRTRLASRWWSAPLAGLPVSALLPEDPSLAEALSRAEELPVVIFQGSRDDVTPLESLLRAGLPQRVKVRVVEGATHSSTWQQAGDALFDAVMAPLQPIEKPAPPAREALNGARPRTRPGS
ncbi:alpha/beta hydrolase [Azohydromonas aeria]|uniref:alpha/beta hydrolase n=1 Tax=Azohydromonas aeria TaxID=2590212 RepID=UPI0012FB75DB|nr:alpha/beta family hydrolase [Azohydromonas aeria]